MPEEKEHYKLTWEMVAVTKLGKYSNADPMVYAHTTQTVPNSQIPDEDWHEKSVEFIRVPYDIAATQRSIIDAGLPRILADRLAFGF